MNEDNITKRSGILSTISLFALLVLAVVLVENVNKSTELRQQASVSNGSAAIGLVPATGTIPTETDFPLSLTGTIPTVAVDGIQFVASISGIPASEISYEPATPSGLILVSNIASPSTDGVLYKIAFITTSPQTPFQTAQNVSFGRFLLSPYKNSPRRFSPTTITISFDTILTKIVQNTTTHDILMTPLTYTYTVIVPSPTPTLPLTPTPTTDTGACVRDNDCGCALDNITNSCAVENTSFLHGHCNTPDYCSGISGRCAPSCVQGRCRLSCP